MWTVNGFFMTLTYKYLTFKPLSLRSNFPSTYVYLYIKICVMFYIHMMTKAFPIIHNLLVNAFFEILIFTHTLYSHFKA